MRGYLILIIVNWLELKKTANANNIPLTELTSEVGADDNKNY
uniref:Chromosome (Plasmid) partitioning protein ParB n=1 Tax=Klebsiella pneumoniae TaxID=573 RepID=A0A8B0SSH6_KLEPN|nr:Chromosome (plasmid) partitioning protein ParB [Klebsiella pneumoniae]